MGDGDSNWPAKWRRTSLVGDVGSRLWGQGPAKAPGHTEQASRKPLENWNRDLVVPIGHQKYGGAVGGVDGPKANGDGGESRRGKAY